MKNLIKKILKEDSEKMSQIEKNVTDLINMGLEEYTLPEDFDEVMVDIGDTKYGKKCSVTFTFKKPFKLEDSDFFHKIFNKDIKRDVNTFFGDYFKSIYNSTSTKENYIQTKEYFKNNPSEF
jgi:hypothetical protein